MSTSAFRRGPRQTCKGLLLAALALASSGCRHAKTTAPAVRTVLNAHVEGRACVEAPLLDAELRASTSVRVAYSLSRFSARFVGPDVAVDLQDLAPTAAVKGSNRFAVEVDGEAMAPLTLVPGQRRTYSLALGLPGGSTAIHTVRISKMTEPLLGEVRFFGFVSRGTRVPPPLPHSRKIWFLGDSITCGYGNTGAGPHCPFDAATEDATLAFSGRLAAQFNADVEVVAFSGRGLWRNLDGSQLGTVPQLWLQQLPAGPAARMEPRHGQADAIVINLGTNDGSAHGELPLRPFTEAWVALLQQLRHQAPKAHIFVALGPMLSNTWAAHPMVLRREAWAINDALAARAAAGDHKVTLVGFTSQDGHLGYGCDYHPSLLTHATMAQHLGDVMAELLQWTQNPVLGRPSQLP